LRIIISDKNRGFCTLGAGAPGPALMIWCGILVLGRRGDLIGAFDKVF
jgi:hypothetical protein